MKAILFDLRPARFSRSQSDPNLENVCPLLRALCKVTSFSMSFIPFFVGSRSFSRWCCNFSQRILSWTAYHFVITVVICLLVIQFTLSQVGFWTHSFFAYQSMLTFLCVISGRCLSLQRRATTSLRPSVMCAVDCSNRVAITLVTAHSIHQPFPLLTRWYFKLRSVSVQF